MPVFSILDDVEQWNTVKKEPLLKADSQTKTRKPDGYRAMRRIYRNRNPPNHANRPGWEAPGDTTSPQVDQQKELNNRFLQAFLNDTVDIDEVQKLLEEGADPNAMWNVNRFVYVEVNGRKWIVPQNWTPLHIAASRSNFEAVRVLLATHRKPRANPNICDDKGRTPLDVVGLHTFPENVMGFTEVLKLLIDAGGRQHTMIEDHAKRFQTPLHTAVRLNNLDAVKLLVEHGAAAGCWNFRGVTPLHLCTFSEDPNKEIFKVLLAEKPDVLDRMGITPLRTALERGWLEGALLALRSGADVTLQAKDGITPLHIISIDKDRYFDDRKDHDDNEKILRDAVLNNIIISAENKAIDCLNKDGATALYLAVTHGRYLIVEKLLKEGASIYHTVDSMNVFHVAAKAGNHRILQMLLAFDFNATKLMINSLASNQGYGPIHFAVDSNNSFCVHVLGQNGANLCLHTGAGNGEMPYPKGSTPLHMLMINSLTSNQGYGPIHFAVDGNHLSCVRVLGQNGANYCRHTGVNTGNGEIPYPKGTTPLHMAAANGNLDIAMSITGVFDNGVYSRFIPCVNVVHECDENGWYPIHSAIPKNKKNIIEYLVLKCNESIIQPTNSEKPETALSMIIQHVANPTDFLKDILDSCISCDHQDKVEISYQVLIPNSSDLRSPKEEMDVIEELLKTGNEFDQKNLLLHPLVESFILLKWQKVKPYYLLIASIYALFLLCLLGFEVSVFYDKDVRKTKPSLLILMVGGFIIYFLTLLIILQELLMNYEGTQYFQKWRTWLKLGSLMPALIVPPALTASDSAEWPRHVSSLTLFLVCFQMMNLLSQFPSGGYYVVMLKKVAINVVKILATFSILLVCFAFSFKIQFRSEYPFNGTWDAIVKTLFMLSSEFDYNKVFDPKKAAALGSSFEVVRIILLAFLVLAAIVLINMMVGVAVDDINKLKSQGKIGRLEKQAHFIRSLDRLNYNIWNSFLRCMPQSYQRRKFPSKIILAGDILTQVPDNGYKFEELPKRIKNAFYGIAQENKEKRDSKLNKYVQYETEKIKYFFIYKDTIQRLSHLKAAMAKMSGDVNTKVDALLRKLETV